MSVLASISAERPLVATDSAFYQHVGWYALQGATPYVDVWDVNPPLTFAVTAVLAFLSRGDMLVLHAMSVGLTMAVAGASVLLTGWLAYTLTGDETAGFVAGLVMLVLPEAYGLAPYGIRSQYFTLFFSVLSLVLALRDHPLAAGVSVAIGAGFWQPGAGFAPLVVGVATMRGGWAGAVAAIVGGGLVTALVVLPFAAAGALIPMVVETIIAPLYSQAPYTLHGRFYSIMLVFGYAVVIFPIAIYGWLRILRARRELWWLPAGALVFGLQMLFVNMNGALDALLWLVFVAMGVAIAIAAIGNRLVHPTIALRPRWAIVAVIGLVVLAGPVWHLVPTAPGRPTLQDRHDRAQPEMTPTLTAEQADVPDVRTIYWRKVEPATCHYRLSWTELRWIAQTAARLDEKRCGWW